MSQTVLLVEDDRWLAECYLAWLDGFGYDVVRVQDAQTALEVLDDRSVNLILLDIMLPFANGIHFLNVLSSHADLMQIPVIVCSGMSPKGLEQQYGVRAVLDKAMLTPALMLSTVSGVLASETV